MFFFFFFFFFFAQNDQKFEIGQIYTVGSIYQAYLNFFGQFGQK